MRNTIVWAGVAAGLVGCGQAAENAAGNGADTAAAEKPRPAYCFFKKDEMKGWAAKADKDGNVVVTGKAYRSDSRYKAVLQPATITGTTAEVSPSITTNDAAYGAPEDWWDVSETIPNSQAVETVNVTCGKDTVASLSVPRTK